MPISMREAQKIAEAIIICAANATQKSKRTGEDLKIFNIDLLLKPSVLKVLTQMLSPLTVGKPKKEGQDDLSKAVSLFLSDMIDAGILCRALDISKKVIKNKLSSHPLNG